MSCFADHRASRSIIAALLVLGFNSGCDRTDESAPLASSEQPVQAPGSMAPPKERVNPPLVPPEPEMIPVERVVVTGATVLGDFQPTEDGGWSVIGIEDATVVVEDGTVVRIVASSTFTLGLGDVVVTAKDRFVMAAPIVVADPGEGGSLVDWLRGGRLIDATLAGVGEMILPENLVNGPHGRCIRQRIKDFEIPAADPRGVDSETLSVLQDGIRIPADRAPADGLFDAIRIRMDAGIDPIEILAGLTRGPAAALGRPGLGTVEPGSTARLLVLDDDPTINPLAILEPYAMTFGDRVMRRAEIEVLRDTSVRGAEMRARIAALEPEGIDAEMVRRWTTSTQGQVFAGIGAGGPDGDIRFSGITGEPRFDAIMGRLRLSPPEGEPNLELSYVGPPESFDFVTTPEEGGLAVALEVEGRDPVNANSTGSTAPPIVDLALDLDVRRALLTGEGPLDLSVQELIYGNGPIGLSPRRYRFVEIDPESCPPCFEGFQRVWNLEILDEERGPGYIAAIATIGVRDGRPSRARFGLGEETLWVDELATEGRPSID